MFVYTLVLLEPVTLSLSPLESQWLQKAYLQFQLLKYRRVILHLETSEWEDIRVYSFFLHPVQKQGKPPITIRSKFNDATAVPQG